ncbi:hypothetical protein [Pseudomonas fluorescens]|uniref:Metallo-hydrolase/oxidoreductase n=2 Tax=Pseudomonas fluorescens TaxID=294 RepID=A0A8B4IIG2_PSEFL|nr:hypothetical protein [Pseudomonas fluorescens]MCI4603726.1 hypothetical protein [Pseudomonas fluorescens]TWR47932.1 hypothetical protein FIP59_12940 [Pseudomonas fluorescens]UKJ68904.1 hypothetical protein H1Q68_29080 [Pseudomonas fluorescens]SNY08882.1 hypothetical protein SAMN04488487_2062 [Pseudomonas fluorescens]SQF97250.1 Uncharacterised protein [Pseudomonas fluorescens]
MNTHFRRAEHPNEEYPSNLIPHLAYACFDHLEVDTVARTVLLAFDLVDAQWLDVQGMQNPLLNADQPDGVDEAWKLRRQFSKRRSQSPFESMPIFRLEIELPDGQRLFDLPPLPSANDPRALRVMAADLERMWFEVEIQNHRGPSLMVAQLYPGLFANAVSVYVKGKMPPKQKAKGLSAVFSLAHLPTISTRHLAMELSSATADLLAVYDVGQGNANALVSTRPFGVPTHYYDLGAGVYRNKHTTPYPLAFCFTQKPPIILSHWDADHWAGAYAVTHNNKNPALTCTWIAPLQVVGPLHIAFAHDVISKGGEFFIYSPPPGEIGIATLPQQRRIRFMRGGGRDRNGTGIVLTVEEPSNIPARSWLLTGDCDYLHFVDELKPLPPVGLVAPHHGADLDSKSPIPKAPTGVGYKRLVYSFGPGNRHGKTPPVQHPTTKGVTLHNSADWDHNRWSLLTPGTHAPGGDILATCEHAPGTSRGGALIGWDRPPKRLIAPCGGGGCSAPLNQS